MVQRQTFDMALHMGSSWRSPATSREYCYEIFDRVHLSGLVKQTRMFHQETPL
jgi:hypothetical protein